MIGLFRNDLSVQRFNCPACGEKMGYGAEKCGKCGEQAPVYNRAGFWRGAVTALVASAVFLLVVTLT